MAMTDEQIERYSRHIILKEVGAKGQKKLLKGKVLIIGAGGLGAPAAMYLAAAGVGTIGIVDADEVDLSNLQRQIIHTTADVGKAKVRSAKETMNAMNPDVTVNTYRMFVDSTNIRELIRDYDFIIDGGVIGSLQAMEAIKYLLGVGDLLTGALLTFDALTMEFHKIKLPKDTHNCAVCGDHPTILEPIDYEQEVCEETAGRFDAPRKEE